jgi:hypothetical protein
MSQPDDELEDSDDDADEVVRGTEIEESDLTGSTHEGNYMLEGEGNDEDN